MSAQTYMSVLADYMGANPGCEPDEISLRDLVAWQVTHLVNESVDFELIGAGLDRPNAEKYGTHPDGSPRYAPEWYVVHGAATGIHEGLRAALDAVLSCRSVDQHGHACIGGIGHACAHHDGDGCNWLDSSDLTTGEEGDA